MSLRPGSTGEQKQSWVGVRDQNPRWMEKRSEQMTRANEREKGHLRVQQRKCPRENTERERTRNTWERGTLGDLCPGVGASWCGRAPLSEEGRPFSAMGVVMTLGARWWLHCIYLVLFAMSTVGQHHIWFRTHMPTVTVLRPSPDSQMEEIPPRGLTESEYHIHLEIHRNKQCL